MVIKWDLMGFYGMYPLVKVCMTMERSIIFNGKNCGQLTISMAIFDSYVSLPHISHYLGLYHSDNVGCLLGIPIVMDPAVSSEVLEVS